nr:unnamed protein product [Digitaria exilis]
MTVPNLPTATSTPISEMTASRSSSINEVSIFSPLPPPADELRDIDAHTVVGTPLSIVGTYAFDTESWNWWCHAGEWSLPFSGKAEYVPELNLWFGLSASRPFHLCAYDLSAVNFDRPPMVCHAWVDLDMPKSRGPLQMDLINLGSGRFCVVKIFADTLPPFAKGLPDDEDDEEAVDCPDVIESDFAVLTSIEVVRCDGEASPPGKLRMLKHMSKYHVFEDHSIKCVL